MNAVGADSQDPVKSDGNKWTLTGCEITEGWSSLTT